MVLHFTFSHVFMLHFINFSFENRNLFGNIFIFGYITMELGNILFPGIFPRIFKELEIFSKQLLLLGVDKANNF